MKKPKTIHVIQGQVYSTADPNLVLTTVLGSCVATCLYDDVNRVGGLNHFLLPDGGPSNAASKSFGVHAMELLINDILKLGAYKPNLVAKVFGGATMITSQSNVGQRNAEFAMNFLKTEGIRCAKTDLGGQMARRIRFWPTNGLAQMKTVQDHSVVDEQIAVPPTQKAADSSIELF